MKDIDIINGIESREKQISTLQEEVAALKKVAEIYGVVNGNASIVTSAPLVKKKFGESKFPISVGDASAQVLKKETSGLHLDQILAEIGKLGVTPTRNSLDAGLRRDGKHRFKLLGNRVWTLADS